MSESETAASLHEYIDAAIHLRKPGSPAQEQVLRDSLAKQKGVQDLGIARDKVSVNYEPLFLTEKEIISAVERAGFKIKDAQVTASSPLTDAFSDDLRAENRQTSPNE